MIHASVSFAMAMSWEDVRLALLRSQAVSAIDEIVVISKATYRVQRLRGLESFGSSPFTDDADLLQKMSLTNSALAAPLSPLAASFDPQSTHVARTSAELGSPTSLQSALATPSAEQQSRGLQHISYTDKQESAVRTIQKYVRRFQLRKGGASGGPLFLAFNDTVQRLQHVSLAEKRTYCFYLRGPMPHVLGFLERFLDYARSAKKAVNQKMKEGEHRALDNLQRKSKKIRSVLWLLCRISFPLTCPFYNQGHY